MGVTSILFILVTGGTGFIGSHVCIELICSGYVPVILDNLSNSSLDVLHSIEKITGTKPLFYEGDVNDSEFLDFVFNKFSFFSVLHLAGLKNIEESIESPELYHKNNVLGSIKLIKAMDRKGLKSLIFSSSASVYGSNHKPPISENSSVNPLTPYSFTKVEIENFLASLANDNTEWNIITLRYFNPVGAHESGLLSDSSKRASNSLFPNVSNVIKGENKLLNIFGGDYDTHDGTCVRDYIHVVDLARGHINALEKLAGHKGYSVVNLGTGIGYSVLEIVHEFERTSRSVINFRITTPRLGDIGSCWADPTLAKSFLGWLPKFDLRRMCEDTWRSQSKSTDNLNLSYELELF